MAEDEVWEWMQTLPNQKWGSKGPNFNGYVVYYENKPRKNAVEVTVYWKEHGVGCRGDSELPYLGNFEEAVRQAAADGAIWMNEMGRYPQYTFKGVPDVE